MSLDSVNQPTGLPTTRTGGTAPVTGPQADPTGKTPGMLGDRTTARRKSPKSGLTGPFKPVDLGKIDWARVPDPGTAQGSRLRNPGKGGTGPLEPMDLKNVQAALTGQMSGADANTTIVDTYAQFDKQFTSYLGNPPVANWTTYGKYAAREAGQEIVRLEVEMRALSLNHPDGQSIISAAQDVIRRPQLLGHCGKALVEDAAHKANLSLSDLSVLACGTGGVFSLFGFLPRVFAFIGFLLQDLKILHAGLLRAHVGIYDNFAPAFDTFLQAESKGQDGVAAVKQKVADGTLSDPNGLLVDALTNYQQAHVLGQEAAMAPDAATKQKLTDARTALVERGNLLIGTQEQYGVAQQAAFDDPRFKELMGRLTGDLFVRDANGTHHLENTGNWADFATRMGFVEVPASVAGRAFTSNADPNGKYIKLTDPQGKMHFYAKNPDPKKVQGTVVDYFNQGATGEAAAKNIAGTPPALEVPDAEGRDPSPPVDVWKNAADVGTPPAQAAGG